LRYCAQCVMPDTKPYISFDEQGVCNACRAHKLKNDYLAGIDWEARKKEFDELALAAKARNAPNWDALVPVSGGKDSLTQVHRLLEYDLRIVAVNVDYGVKTEMGRHNLDRVPQMGANLVIYRPEQDLHRRLIRIGLEDFGDPDLLSHTLLYGFPLHFAIQFRVPLVVLGENSAFEYGGESKIAASKEITRDWFSRYVANQGRDAKFIAERYGIPMSRLKLYDFPDELPESETRAIFMSHYFHWDSEKHLEIAKRHGFRTLDDHREGTYRNYVGIDEKINRVHQYLKALKFGYGRATDHACEDIRNGYLTREAAKELVRKHDLEELSDYYGGDVAGYLGYTKQEFVDILERFRNPTIWKKDQTGTWSIRGHLDD